jgi:hypothetical protein
VATNSNKPETVDCLLLKSGGALKVVLVNFSTIEQEVQFSGIGIGSQNLEPESVTYLEIKGAENV